jgi:hypothetical protein
VDAAAWEGLEREAERSGLVPVIVTLAVEWEPEGDLPPQRRAAQQQRIADARRALLDELADTQFEHEYGFAAAPQLTMSAGADAINVLRRSRHVRAAVEDKPRPLGL